MFVEGNRLLIIPIFDNDFNGLRLRSKENFSSVGYKNETKDQLSAMSIRKLKFAINLLRAISKPQQAYNFQTGKHFNFLLNFITLTLPSPQWNISDKEIKQKYFNTFLVRMKQKYDFNSYVWKAEAQSNGNIHFHITTNCYMNYEVIRNTWNKILSNGNFIDEFEKVNKHRNPNSTDVHSVKNIRNIERYLIKYFCKKEEGKRKIIGKLWDCSENLNYKNRFHFPISESYYKMMSELDSNLKDYKFKLEYCSIYDISSDSAKKMMPDKMKLIYSSYLKKIKSIENGKSIAVRCGNRITNV